MILSRLATHSTHHKPVPRASCVANLAGYAEVVNKIVILAAGRGKRMGQLTDDLPKPMLPVHGKPMLEHVLERAHAAGITEAFLVVGYKAAVIENHFRGYAPVRLTYGHQTEVNGTASAALLARDFASDQPFLLTFGDIFAQPAHYQGVAAALESDPETQAAIAINWVDDPTRGAAVYEQNGVLSRILEKPAPGTSTTHWNSAGIYAFLPSIFAELAQVPLSPRGEYEITSALSQLLEKGQRVRSFVVEGAWRDVGSPEDLQAEQTSKV